MGVFAEGDSLIAAARISGHGAVYGLNTVVTRTGETTEVAQCCNWSENCVFYC